VLCITSAEFGGSGAGPSLTSERMAGNYLNTFAPSATHLSSPTSATKSANSGHGALFDHLVGNQQKVATNCQTKRFSRLQIYYQLELSWLLYRQSGRLCPFEDFVQINGGRPGKIGQVYSI
jgi:hypothetical protein